MTWEKLFKSKILDRGYDYFRRGAVKNLKSNGNRITAEVDGTNIYSVKITLKNGRLMEATCACPYALAGNNCKHMAAVLFDFEKLEYESGTKRQEKVAQVKELMNGVSDEQIRTFLIDEMAQDKGLLNKFIKTIKEQKVEPDYCDVIDAIIGSYLDKNGFIDYYSATYFGQEILKLIDDDISELVTNGQLKEAWKTISHLLLKVSELDIDDSDGEIIMILSETEDIWKDIIKQASDDLKKEMYQWCCTVLDDENDILEDLVEETFANNFNEDNFLKEKLKFTSKKIKQARKSIGSYGDFILDKWVDIYVDLMKRLKFPKDKMRKFYLDNLDSSRVKFLYANFCIEQQDYTAAIEVLKQGKIDSQKDDYQGLTFQYSKKLKNLYQKMELNDDYLNELWLLETEYSVGDVEIYQELKQQYTPEQWEIEREKIFKRLPKYAQVDKLYLADKMYDRLLKFVMENENIYSLEEYEKVLKPKYSKQLLSVYTNIVQKMAQETGNRKYYKKIVRILNRMLSYPDGLVEASKIVKEWQEKYARRPAMMDELKAFRTEY
ncbi:hypothetical protein COSHB9_10700 [Companilactobacillus alimentarius]|uniref:SWIM-type domain-containing protein n=1 Tax=Companilactobacillus alimentarius DSM 20249 TaxID=1423720 RepID=A0A2K9HJZ4_9LACO|nr:SWIM zinc finger family protein [Companilactobacillus alimentarius]AUI72037.1 hypothetical protein LA20249_07540 [Companilactobacillus alimentarius DSM 20249]KRK77990.1 hypothetical protein FC67_GL001324 [Companilactobacillus alimentarius DSM 20249]MDT6952574.1 SWIM zinc finger family protein [Companilactobacillus alimentarius]GEO44808.1 hypothetical protein LAL01_10400 [Companilactobacillus alimentarius]